MKFWKPKKQYYHEIAPDEILLDARNLPQFNTQQMEGRIEQPIPHRALNIIFIVAFVFGVGGIFRLGYLQISKGDYFATRSEKNSFESVPIFADRGLITDRNGVNLAWNEKLKEGEAFSKRIYTNDGGYAHLLGYVGYPKKDASGNYWQTQFTGKSGVESYYATQLEGTHGAKYFETDATGKVLSENITEEPVHGTDVVLSIDARVQTALYHGIEKLATDAGYTGGAGVIMNIHTGEVVAITSYPEYSSNVMSLATDNEKISHYFTDKRKVFINRAIAGRYTPGSIVKPYLALAALNENIISPLKQILSTGQITIPNPFDSTKNTVFKDNAAHGLVDMRKAIAVSSNVYFYEIGGGYKDQKGLGIDRINQYAKDFGIGLKTGIDMDGELAGVVPSVEWKAKTFPKDPWRVGDTYHTSIGQYGFQVTPLQMVRAMAGIASRGTLVTPHIRLNETNPELTKTEQLPFTDAQYQVVHEALRMVITTGTGESLNFPYLHMAGKSGTAQTDISKRRVNSWITGFFPYEKPEYAFVVLMDDGSGTAYIPASHAMRTAIEELYTTYPDFVMQKGINYTVPTTTN